MENSSPLEREADGQSAARNENGTAEGNQQRPDSDGAPSGSAQAPADLSQPGRNLLLHPHPGVGRASRRMPLPASSPLFTQAHPPSNFCRWDPIRTQNK